MSRRAVAEAIVWILTLFFTAQMFAPPVRQLVQLLRITGQNFPP